MIQAANLMAEQLQRVMELEEFKESIGKKLASLEKRIDRMSSFFFVDDERLGGRFQTFLFVFFLFSWAKKKTNT